MSRPAARLHAALACLGMVAALGVAWERLGDLKLRFPPGQAPSLPIDGWKVDPDAASSDELQSLPGVGPRLAQRMVEDRRVRGPFGSLEALDRVPGVGPSMLERLWPHVRFAGAAATVPPRGG